MCFCCHRQSDHQTRQTLHLTFCLVSWRQTARFLCFVGAVAVISIYIVVAVNIVVVHIVVHIVNLILAVL